MDTLSIDRECGIGHFNLLKACHLTCSIQEHVMENCGKCDTCQIKVQLNSLKPWLLHSNHSQLLKFLLKLIRSIRTQTKILEYLNNLLTPLLLDAKDLVYSRNSKIKPSLNRDCLKISQKNNENIPLSDELNDCITWYLQSNYFVKLNFLINLFQKCDYSVVYACNLAIQSYVYQFLKISSDTSWSHGIYMPLRYECCIDFIKLLPVYVSKRILCSLDQDSLKKASYVSKYWYDLICEIEVESKSKAFIIDELINLNATTSKFFNPVYVNYVQVPVPNVEPKTQNVLLNENARLERNLQAWKEALKGVSIRKVMMEERNVFCGSYNLFVLKEKRDSQRVAHLNGSHCVAYASINNKIQFIDLKSYKDRTLCIQGHAASIKCMHINENENYLLTGSYDTSIRCWNLNSGKCLKMFLGHRDTVTCLSMFKNCVISGSKDKTCRVWNFIDKTQIFFAKHEYAIASVAIFDDICVSGSINGEVRVYNIKQKTFIKSIQAHKGLISGIKLDKWHIVTCGTDGYALGFSTQGKHDKCLVAMRHPKAVTCIEYQYLRVITGSSDGKIRIWNLLNGDCLRVMRGNSQCDPIYSLSTYDNKILINTEFNLILMEFERIKYEYGSKQELEKDRERSLGNHQARKITSKRSHPQMRAKRYECFNTYRSIALPKTQLRDFTPTKCSINTTITDISSREQHLSELDRVKQVLKEQYATIKQAEMNNDKLSCKAPLTDCSRSFIFNDKHKSESKGSQRRPTSSPERLLTELKLKTNSREVHNYLSESFPREILPKLEADDDCSKTLPRLRMSISSRPLKTRSKTFINDESLKTKEAKDPIFTRSKTSIESSYDEKSILSLNDLHLKTFRQEFSK